MRRKGESIILFVVLYIVLGVAWGGGCFIWNDGTMGTPQATVTTAGGLLALSAFYLLSVLHLKKRHASQLEEKIEAAREENARFDTRLSLQRQLFHTMIDESPLPLILHAEDGSVLRVSEVFMKKSGYTSHDIPTVHALSEKLPIKRKHDLHKRLLEAHGKEKRKHEGEIEIMTRAKKKRLWDFHSIPIGRDIRGVRSTLTIGLDVTETSEQKDEALKKAYYDDLTALYNRRFHDETLATYDRHEHVGMLVADINGLKLINDVFGHKAGDATLKAFARMLKRHLPKESVISRYGGDEFAAIIPGVKKSIVRRAIQNIKRECDTQPYDVAFISASFGYALKSKHRSMNDVFKRAENMLYKDKIHEYHAQTRRIIDILTDKLYERTDETPEHISRLESLAYIILKQLDLTKQERRELFLLIKLHDIGKVSLESELCEKDYEDLSEDERETFNRHTEIGYRMANALPRLKNVAYAILTHHEHVDGSGYPFGLSGDDIPATSRLFRIIDDYDMLMNNRALCKNDALQAMQEKRGTHYDETFLDLFTDLMRQRET